MTNDNNTADLEYLISKQMRMAHVYQPVMIKALLERGGEATTEEIAKSLLAYDEPETLSYQITLFGPIGADVRHYWSLQTLQTLPRQV